MTGFARGKFKEVSLIVPPWQSQIGMWDTFFQEPEAVGLCALLAEILAGRDAIGFQSGTDHHALPLVQILEADTGTLEKASF